jgi:hypothetical protein
MVGQFNETVRIVDGGAAIEVTGPVDWEDDEFGAVIHARVKQNGVVGSGASTFVRSSDATWSAKVFAHGGGTFEAGVGVPTRANAQVSLIDGRMEPYNWDDTVELTR